MTNLRTIYGPSIAKIAEAARASLLRLVPEGAVEPMVDFMVAAIALDRATPQTLEIAVPLVEALETTLCAVPDASYPKPYDDLFDGALRVIQEGPNWDDRHVEEGTMDTLSRHLAALYDHLGIAETCYVVPADARTDWVFDSISGRFSAPDGSEQLTKDPGEKWWVVDAEGTNRKSGPYHDPQLAGVPEALVREAVFATSAAARINTGTLRLDNEQNLDANRVIGAIVPAVVLAMEASLRILLPPYGIADPGIFKMVMLDEAGNWQIECGHTYSVVYVAAPSGRYNRQGWVVEGIVNTPSLQIGPEDGGSMPLAFLPLTAGPEDLFAQIMRAHAADMLERITLFDADARDSVAETPFAPTTALAEAHG